MNWPEDRKVLPVNTVVQGDALSILKTFPDECIQCCITSPPYFGLRDYGLEPLIWGGKEDCVHVWGNEKFKIQSPQRDHDGQDFGETRGQENSRKGMSMNASQGQFCQLCGAWRGSLGLEPSPDCGRPFMELRSDLTEKEIKYVMAELKRMELI